MNFILAWLAKIGVKRLVTGSLIALLAAGGAWFYSDWKAGIEDRVRAECNESRYIADLKQANDQLAAEQKRVRRLEQLNSELRAENENAITRREEAEDRVTQLLRDREEQEQNDDTYAEWSNTPVPDGVIERLRRLQERPD